jgi:hypothetical protein
MRHETVTVTAGKFGVSVDTGSYFKGFRLCIYRFVNGKLLKGEGDGLLFDTREQANAWASEHGHTKPFRRRVWCLEHRTLHTFIGKPSPTYGECFHRS